MAVRHCAEKYYSGGSSCFFFQLYFLYASVCQQWLRNKSCRNFQGSTSQVVSLCYKGTIPKVSQSRNLCAGMLRPPLLCVFALFDHMLFALRLAAVKFDLLLVLEKVMGVGGGLSLLKLEGSAAPTAGMSCTFTSTPSPPANQNPPCLNSRVEASSMILFGQTIRRFTETVVQEQLWGMM